MDEKEKAEKKEEIATILQIVAESLTSQDTKQTRINELEHENKVLRVALSYSLFEIVLRVSRSEFGLVPQTERGIAEHIVEFVHSCPSSNPRVPENIKERVDKVAESLKEVLMESLPFLKE